MIDQAFGERAEFIRQRFFDETAPGRYQFKSGVMDSLGLLGLYVERMPKERNVEFHGPETCPYSSVCTPSTHDMSTVREWWQEARDVTERYYWTCMHQWGDPPETCEVWISRAIVDRHLRSPAMWAVFLLQDVLGMSEVLRRDDPLLERINVPGNRWHYWRSRMHLPLEELLEADAFNMQLRELIGETGRLT